MISGFPNFPVLAESSKAITSTPNFPVSNVSPTKSPNSKLLSNVDTKAFSINITISEFSYPKFTECS